MNKNQRKLNKLASIFGIQTKSQQKKAIPEDNVPESFKQKVKLYNKYSDELKAYIQKCFAQCDNDDQQTFVSNQLVQKIADYSIRGTLQTHNWSEEKVIQTGKSKPVIMNSWAQLVKPAETLAFKSSTILNSNTAQQAQSTTTGESEKTQPTPFKAAVSPAQVMVGINKFKFFQDNGQKKEESPKESQTSEEKVTKAAKKKNKKKKGSESAMEQPTQETSAKETPKSKKQAKNVKIEVEEKITETEPVSKKEKKKKDKKAKDNQNKQKSKILDSLLDMDLNTISNIKIFKGKDKKVDDDIDLISNAQKIKRAVTHSMSFEDLVEYNRIVGTSTALEKPYLRLTSEPNPEDVRPPSVLQKSLDFCLNKFAQNGEYQYIRDQLRSIRQDLTVQHVEDEFAVHVYETSLRLAVENFDWDNFNQCLNPLEALYANGLGQIDSIAEIESFKIIYLTRFQNSFDLYQAMPKIEESVGSSAPVKFAIRVWRAIAGGDWSAYFKLYKEASPMQRNVLSTSLPGVRYEALLKTQKAFRNLSLKDYAEILCFDDINEAKKYLDEKEVTYIQK